MPTNSQQSVNSPVSGSRFSGDVHGCTALLFIPADVFAELGIHERFFAGLPAFLAVFDPQKLFCDTVPQEFFADLVIVGKTPVCHRLVAREQKLLERTVSHAEIERP